MSFAPLSPEDPTPSDPTASPLQKVPLSTLPPTAPFTVPLSQALQRLFSEEERVIVLTLNEAGHLTQYEVKPLAEVIVLLDLHGFGHPLPNAFPRPQRP